MASIPPANPINHTPLPIEQPPPNVMISSYNQAPKSHNSFSIFFNFLFFLFGISGIGYGMYIRSQINTTNKVPSKTPTKISITQTQPSPTVMHTRITPQIASSSASSSISTGETVVKETLCFTLTIPQKNDAGAENNCDITYRSFPDQDNPNTSVSMSITLNNKEYTDSQDMADKWLQMEKDHGSEDTFVEKGFVQVGGVEGYKVVTEYANKAVQTTHIFVYHPGKYEAYGYPVTGFELLTSSDVDTRAIQQVELERLLSTWKWK